MTDDTPTQPTGSGTWIWHKPLTRDVVAFGTLPDPRDARIEYLDAQVAELVHSLKSINAMTIDYSMGNPDERLEQIGEIVDLTLYEDEPEWIRRVDVANARIAELEAALRDLHKLSLDPRFGQGKRIGQAVEFIEAELWTPERDMAITQEAMDA